jgi:quercetin dioxygenase-like cupin family protein
MKKQRKEVEHQSAIINLKTQIKYQKDSIVSKQIIFKKTGNITLFAFDKGQQLSEHTSPYDAFVIIIEGKATISIDKKPYLVQKGEAIILPAYHPHAVYAEEKFKMLLVLIK